MTCPAEAEARGAAAVLAAKLRARGDPDSLDAAAMIEGHLTAYATLVREKRETGRRLAEVRRLYSDLLDQWARVPQDAWLPAIQRGKDRPPAS